MLDSFWCNTPLDEFQTTNSGTFIADTWTFTPLGCFDRAQEYVIASTNYKMRDEGWPYMSGIFELPSGLYPIGNVVQLTQDLPLLTSREDDAETITISAGSYVALVGTDCEKWGYVRRSPKRASTIQSAAGCSLLRETLRTSSSMVRQSMRTSIWMALP